MFMSYNVKCIKKLNLEICKVLVKMKINEIFNLFGCEIIGRFCTKNCRFFAAVSAKNIWINILII